MKNILDDLKQFLYNEIIERRDYSASKSFEIVLEEISRLESKKENNNYEYLNLYCTCKSDLHCIKDENGYGEMINHCCFCNKTRK